jgi:TetR/AcrR family transcriptional regulator, transcriptional repressor for nem operon
VGCGVRGKETVVAEPKTARGRERKRAIISAAAALMHEHGVKATGVDDVLVASGCGKSQFYHYFSSKDDLAAAVLDLQLETVFDGASGFRLDTWTGIRAWFDSLIAGQEQRGLRGCPVGSLSVELSASGPSMQREVARSFSRWEDLLAASFESMKDKGLLAPGAQPELLAETTLAAIQGGYLLSTARGEIRPMQTALAAAYTQLRASRARPAHSERS